MDYLATCKAEQVNPEYPLGPLNGLRLEFEKGANGGYFCPRYMREKLDMLASWAVMLERHAAKQDGDA